MTKASELRTGLSALAKRSTGLMPACTNQECTKLYLVLPFLGLLGYDYANPYAVYPKHVATGIDGTPVTTDLAVLDDGNPVIAVDCATVGSDLTAHFPALAKYFNSQPPVKLAILTNGIVYHLYVDSDEPGKLDAEPYLSFDLETIALDGVTDEVLESILRITEAHFDPDTIAETAHLQIISKRLRTALVEEAKGPTEAFCRFALSKVGLNGVSKEAIETHYAKIIQTAFEESLILPVAQRLKSDPGEGGGGPVSLHNIGQRVQTSDRELGLMAYIRRRLAYLCDDSTQFEAIDNVHSRDYIGRVSIYYDREQRGRLFDFIPGVSGPDKFIFPDPIGEIVTEDLADIDEALRVTFQARVHELNALSHPDHAAQSA
ncbi:MAG: hypothetical protein ACRBCJ_12200 [Hyphomicrobiaceae bacterium]